MSKARKAVAVDDSEIWALFRHGDEPAFNTLIEKYSRSLFNYGYRFVNDKDIINDCIQDVFLELWKSRERISQTPSVKFYLFKAVRLRIFKQNPKWNSTEVLTADYNFTVEFNAESKLIAEQDFEELSLKVKKVINALPERQREIIYLRYYEELDFDKIAEIMNISKQSLYNLLQKAFKSFRTEWQIFMLFLSYLKPNNIVN